MSSKFTKIVLTVAGRADAGRRFGLELKLAEATQGRDAKRDALVCDGQ